MRTALVPLIVIAFIGCKSNDEPVNKLKTKLGKSIELIFWEEFANEPILIVNSDDTVFATNYITYYPGIEGSSLEQDSKITFTVFVPNPELGIQVTIGTQSETINLLPNESVIYIAQFVRMTDIAQLSTMKHYPFCLSTPQRKTCDQSTFK